MDITSIYNLLQIFTDYGGHYAIVAACGFLLWRFRPIICRLFRRFVRRWLGIDTRRPVKESTHTYSSIDVVIIQTLDALLARTGACRAWVFEFDGYDDRLKPLPFVTQSCTYERLAPGRSVKSEKDGLQNMPLAAYPGWCRRLAEDMEIALEKIDHIKDEDVETWKALAGQKISSLYAVFLTDYRGVPLGVVGVDFTDGVMSTLKRKEDKNKFFMMAVAIAGLLTHRRNGSLQKMAGEL